MIVKRADPCNVLSAGARSLFAIDPDRRHILVALTVGFIQNGLAVRRGWPRSFVANLMTSDLALLSIEYRTLFVLDEAARIVTENDPDCSRGPRVWIAGCVDGCLAGVRNDVPDDAAAEILQLAAQENLFVAPSTRPLHIDRYEALLAETAPPQCRLGRIYELPHGLRYGDDVTLITSEDDKGERFQASIATDGMPPGLAELGFREAADLWAPWCIVLIDGEIASIAFAARLSEIGAELGLATVPRFRARGYGAAATAGWSRLRSLRSRKLFYSTDQGNLSSQRVAGRLGLRFVAASLRLT